eukprot:gnl/TRDRNA2_/TRDRNA2_143467_c0_seq1.p1 gnl/TRDRNA2_/TRDRNA2_143467_c0~~gnl/TRDRNA2_/TRDRNA2_143467_c0_seq1.p1  ORF type:complete len:477 (-),score=67.62 gnl/TRDRNA2_/TRDRNA2_143467_c0_seq1:52-1482(-)
MTIPRSGCCSSEEAGDTSDYDMSQAPKKIYGSNRVLCKGRLITGPDARSCIGSFGMILVPSIIWQIEVGSFFADRYSILIPLTCGFLQIASLVLLVNTCFSDPGIMPRQKDYTEYFDSQTKMFRTKQPPRYHDIVLHSHLFKVKYCTTCNIYRPPRCTHCSVCENCVEKFDHHCPWIGNCIGKRNYRRFYAFVTTTGTLNVYVLATSAAHLALTCQDMVVEENRSVSSAILMSMSEEPLSAALIVYSLLIVWFTVGLCLYHTYLILTNQTTYEQIKGVYNKGSHPFHRGILRNCGQILFAKVRPRYFDPYTNQCFPPLSPPMAASACSPGDPSDVKLRMQGLDDTRADYGELAYGENRAISAAAAAPPPIPQLAQPAVPASADSRPDDTWSLGANPGGEYEDDGDGVGHGEDDEVQGESPKEGIVSSFGDLFTRQETPGAEPKEELHQQPKPEQPLGAPPILSPPPPQLQQRLGPL